MVKRKKNSVRSAILIRFNFKKHFIKFFEQIKEFTSSQNSYADNYRVLSITQSTILKTQIYY